MRSPAHIVQIGYDETVFAADAPSDTLERQLRYGRELARQRPGGRLTLLSLVGSPVAKAFTRENVTFVPQLLRRKHHWFGVWSALGKMHHENPISVITAQTPHEDGWLVLRFANKHGLPAVAQIHYDFFSPIARREHLGGGLRGYVRDRLARRALPRMAAVRVVGSRVGAQLRESHLSANVHVLPVPVTLPPAAVQEGSGLSAAPHVVFVGRLAREKNLLAWLDVAARVAKRDKQVQFDLIGDGPLRSSLEEHARLLGISGRVCFHGAVPYQELAAHYQRAAVFLLTSHYEGFGRVALEAYLQRVPVVAPAIAGVEDIVHHGETGFLLSPGDHDGMAVHVTQLLHNSGLRRRLGQAGFEHVRASFDPENLTRRWITLLLNPCMEVTGHDSRAA